MFSFYLAMIAITALHLYRLNPPREAAHWLPLVALSVAWPVCIGIACYGAITRK